MLQSLQITFIPVSNQSVSISFYCDKLGFEIVQDIEIDQDKRWVQLRIANDQSSICLHKVNRVLSPVNFQLGVSNIEQFIESLKGKGIVTSDLEYLPYGKLAHFSDPDGNHFTLKEAIT